MAQPFDYQRNDTFSMAYYNIINQVANIYIFLYVSHRKRFFYEKL